MVILLMSTVDHIATFSRMKYQYAENKLPQPRR